MKIYLGTSPGRGGLLGGGLRTGLSAAARAGLDSARACSAPEWPEGPRDAVGLLLPDDVREPPRSASSSGAVADAHALRRLASASRRWMSPPDPPGLQRTGPGTWPGWLKIDGLRRSGRRRRGARDPEQRGARWRACWCWGPVWAASGRNGEVVRRHYPGPELCRWRRRRLHPGGWGWFGFNGGLDSAVPEGGQLARRRGRPIGRLRGRYRRKAGLHAPERLAGAG